MFQLYFWIIVGILVFDFLFGWVLDTLNAKAWKEEVPEPLTGIYDRNKYAKSQHYFRDNLKFGRVTSVFSLSIMLAMLFSGGFGFLDQKLQPISSSPLVHSLLFFGILGLGFDLLNTPFSLYRTFVIEEKYGFNKTTPGTWLKDKLKSWLLAVVIGGGLLAAIIWVYQKMGPGFWIVAWAIVAIFMLLMTMFYSDLIVPLFNKQKPLDPGSLRDKITELCHKTGYQLKEIYVIDGSRRSTKANAYFSGLGPRKRIVLYDTLIEDMEEDEIVAVLAHEIGHYRKKHTLQGYLISIFQTGLTLFLLSLFIARPELQAALGGEGVSFHMGLIGFGLIFSPVSTLLGIGVNILSRRNEYAADHFAREQGLAPQLKEALKKMSVKHLSNLTPHPVYVFVHYSHPPLLARLHALG